MNTLLIILIISGWVGASLLFCRCCYYKHLYRTQLDIIGTWRSEVDQLNKIISEMMLKKTKNGNDDDNNGPGFKVNFPNLGILVSNDIPGKKRR